MLGRTISPAKMAEIKKMPFGVKQTCVGPSNYILDRSALHTDVIWHTGIHWINFTATLMRPNATITVVTCLCLLL